MFLKEYRICLPMSVEEYRIAQLYMILKKSREETHGEGSGIEILVNEAYEEGPGGKGQYTHKIYHIGSHLPGWFRSILPKSALVVEEKSWNAYPYTKTIYRCPFIEKFTLAIETRYYCDGGHQDNVFGLTGNELRNRVVDYIDIVKDPISSGDYKKEEDPRLYQSRKTGRGPLGEDWRQEYTEAALNPYGKNQAIMCAYKLCRVEFKYWGMQSKIERFIHDIGLRKTMVRAHRQAWAWQDEWYGLTIDEIRRLELETQLALQEKMACTRQEESDGKAEQNHVPQSYEDGSVHHHQVAVGSLQTKTVEPRRELEHRMTHSRNQSWSSRNSGEVSSVSRSPSDRFMESLEQLKASSSDEDEFFDAQDTFDEDDLLLNPRSGMIRSSSMEIVTGEEDLDLGSPVGGADNEQSPLDRRMEQYRNLQTISGGHSLDSAMPTQAAPPPAAVHNCKTTILFLILHGGSVLDVGQEVQGSKHSDITTFKATLETVLRAHYPAVYGHIAVRFVPCPAVCADALTLLTSLSPFSHEAHSPGVEANIITNESLPMGAISLLATAAPDYQETVASVIAKANAVYNDFLRSEDGLGFTGQVCFIGDSTGSIIGYDMLCRQNPYFACRQMSRCGSQGSLTDMEPTDNPASVSHHHVSRQTNLETIKQVSVSNPDLMEGGKSDGTSPPQTAEPGTNRNTFVRHSSCPASRRTSTNSNPDVGKLEFDVSDFFMFGSPLALVLAFRKMLYGTEKISHYRPTPQLLDPCVPYRINILPPDEDQDMLPRPLCHQMYNLFYTSDPTAARLEPLLVDKFRLVAPMKLPRYQKFPLGDGSPVHLVETIQSHSDIFIEQPSPGLTRQDSPFQERRSSNLSISSQLSGNCDLAVTSITSNP